MEGNRRCTALKTIITDRKDTWISKLNSAQKAGNALREGEAKDQLDKIAQIENAARTLEVKPLLAKSEDELKRDLTVLLSVRHINGARQWSRCCRYLVAQALSKCSMNAIRNLWVQVG